MFKITSAAAAHVTDKALLKRIKEFVKRLENFSYEAIVDKHQPTTKVLSKIRKFRLERNCWIEEIDPDMSLDYLTINIPDNRDIGYNTVYSYGVALIIGEFLYNGDTVRFDVEGRLIDGQHRLIATYLTGIPAPQVMVTGIAVEAIATIDTGKMRTSSDVLKMNGLGGGYAISVASCIKSYLYYKRTSRVFTVLKHQRYSNYAVLGWALDNPHLVVNIERMAAVANSSYPKGKYLKPSQWTFLMMILTEESGKPSLAGEFLDRLAYVPEGKPDKDDLVYQLRAYLEKLSNLKYISNTREFYTMKVNAVVKAWNYYATGRRIVKNFALTEQERASETIIAIHGSTRSIK